MLLTKAQVALVRYDYKMAALALAAAQPLVTKVADALAIDNDGASQPTVGASQPTTDASVAIPTKNMHLLYLHFLALSILFHFHTGNTTVASAYLAKCHAALEQADDSGSDTMDCSPNATPEDGSAAQPLSSAFPLLSGGQLNLLDGAITMQWLTKYEFFSVVYLLSGLCMTSEANLVPSKKYLLEGFKFLEGMSMQWASHVMRLTRDANILSFTDEYDKPATTINTHLFITLKAHLFRQLLFTLLQKNEWSECEKLLPLYMDHCWSSGGATSALWRAHEWDIAVARAHIHQAMGELGLALKEFEGVAKVGWRKEVSFAF